MGKRKANAEEYKSKVARRDNSSASEEFQYTDDDIPEEVLLQALEDAERSALWDDIPEELLLQAVQDAEAIEEMDFQDTQEKVNYKESEADIWDDANDEI